VEKGKRFINIRLGMLFKREERLDVSPIYRRGKWKGPMSKQNKTFTWRYEPENGRLSLQRGKIPEPFNRKPPSKQKKEKGG